MQAWMCGRRRRATSPGFSRPRRHPWPDGVPRVTALDFKSHLFQTFAEIPSYSTWLVKDADLTSTCRYRWRVTQLLQRGEPERPWRLKCPSHVLWLDALFPAPRQQACATTGTARKPTACSDALIRSARSLVTSRIAGRNSKD